VNYGKIYIATNNWQTGTPIEDYNEGVAYFTLFGEQCKCSLIDPVVYHKIETGEWIPFERARDIIEVRTPEINIELLRKTATR